MVSRSLSVVLVAGGLVVAGAVAPVHAEGFSVELNDAIAVGDGCRIVYVAHNGTGVALHKTAFDVFTFDASGKVVQSLVFQFGAFPVGKTKVMQFDLPDQPCDDISRLLINDATECVADESAPTLCLDALTTSSRTNIAFGL